MKLGTVSRETLNWVALHAGSSWINLSGALAADTTITEVRDAADIQDIRDLIAAGLCSEDRISDLTANWTTSGILERFSVEAPDSFALPLRPGKIVALGRNYAAHAAELGNKAPVEPLFFVKTATACISDGEGIVIRDEYGRVDYEGELAVVIGKRATRIASAAARDYIAGYTLVNDVTAREMQKRDTALGHPWFRSKNLDTFCPVGPMIALPRSLGWPVNVELTVRVNGALKQRGTTDHFLFSIPDALAYVTQFMTLEPGDMLSTGTPEGVGPLNDGDVVEVSVPEIGVLRNVVRRAAD